MWLADDIATPSERSRPEIAASLVARFDFSGRFGPYGCASISGAQQAKFQDDFKQQLARVAAQLTCYRDRDGAPWLSPAALLPARPLSGPYRPRADLHVFVSDGFERARSLVPAWSGQRGLMEFPAHRAVAGEAPIAHELVHVLFPNGNRMLAEGLAVYLQCKLYPSIATYPNFGCSLEAVLADFLHARCPGRPWDALWGMDLSALEAISTPDKVSLRIGRRRIGARPGDLPSPQEEEKVIYAIAGSLVELLLENPIGDDLLTEANFGSLYKSTPLRPFERDSGAPDRWQRCYQGNGRSYTFDELGLIWKTYMHFLMFRGTAARSAVPLPEEFARMPLVAALYDKLDAMTGLAAAPRSTAGKRKAKLQPPRPRRSGPGIGATPDTNSANRRTLAASGL